MRLILLLALCLSVGAAIAILPSLGWMAWFLGGTLLTGLLLTRKSRREHLERCWDKSQERKEKGGAGS